MSTISAPTVEATLPAWTEKPDPRALLAAADPEIYERLSWSGGARPTASS